MPVFNEEECLAEVLSEWHPCAEEIGATLLLINDGSKDKSLEVLLELQKKYPFLMVADKENSGHGPTCLAGYKYALAQDYEWIFQTDSDGQTRANEFKSLWNQERDKNLAYFGYRPKRGDGLSRQVISKILSLVIFITHRIWVRDANVPFRLMHKDLLRTSIDGISENFFLANALQALNLCKNKTLSWVPISFSPRIGGTASVRWLRFVSIGVKVFKDFFKIRDH